MQAPRCCDPSDDATSLRLSRAKHFLSLDDYFDDVHAKLM
jgi:hypothetical protein